MKTTCLTMVDPVKDKHQAQTQGQTHSVRVVIESETRSTVMQFKEETIDI